MPGFRTNPRIEYQVRLEVIVVEELQESSAGLDCVAIGSVVIHDPVVHLQVAVQKGKWEDLQNEVEVDELHQ